MCGIAGFIDGSKNIDEANKMLSTMLEKTAHRGPDFTGTFFDLPVALGHNRLSIIDLTDAANQPMLFDRFVISFNGEIYNYLEIKDELQKLGYVFATHSDTEVVLVAYSHWGEKCVDHFVGMWAFAIWDRTAKKLFCSTDRFGIKPFYFIHSGKQFYFGSEYKALKPTPVFDGKINVDQVARGMQLGWVVYENETYFKCINRIPAGYNLTFADGKLAMYRYWDIHLNSKIDCSDEEVFDTFHRMMTESIKIHTRSDVEIGSCLSGGIDSSTIVSTISTLFPHSKLNSFTMYYQGKDKTDVDERPWAKAVTDQYPNVKPWYYTPSDDELYESFLKAQHFADVPIAGSSYMSQYFVMKLVASKGIKVVINGQGADEYLGGYLHSFDRLLGQMVRSFNFIDAAKSLNQHRILHQLSPSQTLFGLSKGILSAFGDEQTLYKTAFKHKGQSFVNNLSQSVPFMLDEKLGGNKFDQFLYHLIFSTTLPTLLHFEDRNSMAFSIESRVPFLDHRLVEYAFTLASNFKIRQGVTKFMLRESMKKELPAAIYNRQDKKGFVTPGEQKWLQSPLKPLLNFDFKDYDFIDNRLAKQALEQYHGGKNNCQTIWKLAALNLWLKSQ